jgi:hypothetical protein
MEYTTWHGLALPSVLPTGLRATGHARPHGRRPAVRAKGATIQSILKSQPALYSVSCRLSFCTICASLYSRGDGIGAVEWYFRSPEAPIDTLCTPSTVASWWWPPFVPFIRILHEILNRPWTFYLVTLRFSKYIQMCTIPCLLQAAVSSHRLRFALLDAIVLEGKEDQVPSWVPHEPQDPVSPTHPWPSLPSSHLKNIPRLCYTIPTS